MKLRLTLATATALSMLMATGVAYAGGNTSFNSQTGDSNSATITQSGSNNNLGYIGDPVLQDGTSNTLSITQSGNNNNAGTDESSLPSNSSNAVFDTNSGIEQHGNSNSLTITQGGYLGVVGEIVQTEDGDAMSASDSNQLIINQKSGSQTNVVRKVTQTQTGADGSNYANIQQNGYNNAVGSRNSRGFTGLFQSSSNGGSNTASFVQGGNSNSINYVSQNAGDTANSTSKNSLYVNQSGISNTIDSVLQNANTYLINNPTNIANIYQSGNSNYVRSIRQDGRGSTQYLTLNFSGSGNGGSAATAFSDPVALSVGLQQATVRQDGQGNNINYTFSGSNNLFAFQQFGTDNLITGTLSGNSNQLAVKQGDSSATSDNNQASINGSGSLNDIGIMQSGIGTNHATVTVNSNSNTVQISQAGYNNYTTVSE